MKILMNKVRKKYSDISAGEFISLLGINSSMYYDIKKGKRKNTNHGSVLENNRKLKARLNKLLEAV